MLHILKAFYSIKKGIDILLLIRIKGYHLAYYATPILPLHYCTGVVISRCHMIHFIQINKFFASLHSSRSLR